MHRLDSPLIGYSLGDVPYAAYDRDLVLDRVSPAVVHRLGYSAADLLAAEQLHLLRIFWHFPSDDLLVLALQCAPVRDLCAHDRVLFHVHVRVLVHVLDRCDRVRPEVVLDSGARRGVLFVRAVLDVFACHVRAPCDHVCIVPCGDAYRPFVVAVDDNVVAAVDGAGVVGVVVVAVAVVFAWRHDREQFAPDGSVCRDAAAVVAADVRTIVVSRPSAAQAIVAVGLQHRRTMKMHRGQLVDNCAALYAFGLEEQLVKAV